MADNDEKIQVLKEMYEQIRDERGIHANTASRIGNAFLALLSYVSDGIVDVLPFLRKDRDDSTTHKVTLGELQVTGNTILGDAVIDSSANASLRSLTVTEFIETAEFRKNLTTVYAGVDWHTVGRGLIEDVTQMTSTTGTITLKLESDQIGAVEVDDLCMGVFNADEGNATEDEDQHNGNMQFVGSITTYFRITSIVSDDGTRRVVSYALRPKSTNWTKQFHPQKGMTFAVFANTSNTNRQSCRYSTPRYTIGLEDMDDWEFDSSNIYYILGDLNGFYVNGTWLKGKGIYIGNGYFSGQLMQLLGVDAELTIDTNGINAINSSESVSLVCKVKRAYKDITSEVATWKIERESGVESLDADWNNAASMTDSSYSISWSDFPLAAHRVLFRVTAYDSDAAELDSAAIVISKANATEGFVINFAEVDNYYDADNFRAPLTLVATYDGIDITDLLEDSNIVWSRYSERDGVQREGSDEAWGIKKGSSGKSIVLTKTDLDVDSLGMPDYIKFTATATLDEQTASVSFEY